MLGVLVVSHVQSWLIPSITFAAYSYFWYIQRSSYFVLLIVIEVILFYVSLVAPHSLFCILWVVGAHPIRGGGIWSVEDKSPSWCAHNLLPNLPQPSICICNVKGWSRTLLIMFYWCHCTWTCGTASARPTSIDTYIWPLSHVSHHNLCKCRQFYAIRSSKRTSISLFYHLFSVSLHFLGFFLSKRQDHCSLFL
mgnify:CR=1 FL=1